MKKEFVYNVVAGEIVKWARGKSEFTDELHLSASLEAGVEFALVEAHDVFQRYLVAARRGDYKRPNVRLAERAILGVLYASRGRWCLVKNRTELVVRENSDTQESWRVKLRSACSRLDLNPDLIDELRSSQKKKKRAS